MGDSRLSVNVAVLLLWSFTNTISNTTTSCPFAWQPSHGCKMVLFTCPAAPRTLDSNCSTPHTSTPHQSGKYAPPIPIPTDSAYPMPNWLPSGVYRQQQRQQKAGLIMLCCCAMGIPRARLAGAVGNAGRLWEGGSVQVGGQEEDQDADSQGCHLYRQAGFLTLHLWVITSNSQAASSFNSEGIDITDDTVHDPVPGAYASHAWHNNELFLGAFFFSPTTGYIVFITIYYNGSLAWVLVLFVSPPKNMLEKKMLEQWKT
ncbi:hypothetical protein F5146DRAFT_1006030 [Armillaria mellea]|nr:hypothetical protein F5146DRAFT_1006030 [Armillaria mellea]